ncbi:hypothetical protein SHL15_0174 [Streptomyces hygroscopicus subsp. limoneus]|nr:hypothetical protein SHL15_0174 [Streptomyces hygroscopicus subsp. limoneus]
MGAEAGLNGFPGPDHPVPGRGRRWEPHADDAAGDDRAAPPVRFEGS